MACAPFQKAQLCCYYDLDNKLGVWNPCNKHTVLGQKIISVACSVDFLHIAGLVQDSGNSIANALELPQSCSKPLIYRKSFIVYALCLKLTSHAMFTMHHAKGFIWKYMYDDKSALSLQLITAYYLGNLLWFNLDLISCSILFLHALFYVRLSPVSRALGCFILLLFLYTICLNFLEN